MLIKSWQGKLLFKSRHEDMRGTLRHAIEQGADLRFADLRGSSLVGFSAAKTVVLFGAVFDGCDLSHAVLTGADLQQCFFKGAKLDCANLRRANLSYSQFTDATLFGAVLNHAELCSTNMERADLGRVRARGAVFNGAYLGFTNLSCADLREALLYRTVVYGAKLRGTIIIDAGQDARGYHFWAWKDYRNEGRVIYRVGCREWTSFDEAWSHYGPHYHSDGDVYECRNRLTLLRSLSQMRK